MLIKTIILIKTFGTKIESVTKKGVIMIWTIAIILIVLWLLGLVSSYTMGGFIHILLVIAIIMILVRLIQGRNPVA